MAGRGCGRQGVHTARAHACASVAREGCRRDRPRRRDWPGTSSTSVACSVSLPDSWVNVHFDASGRPKSIEKMTNLQVDHGTDPAAESRQRRSRRTRCRMPPLPVIADLVRRVEPHAGLELDRIGAVPRGPDAHLARRGARGGERLVEAVDVDHLLPGEAQRLGAFRSPGTEAAGLPSRSGSSGGCAHSSPRSPPERRAAPCPSPPSRATSRIRTPCPPAPPAARPRRRSASPPRRSSSPRHPGSGE